MKKLFLLGAVALCALSSCTNSSEGYKVNVTFNGDLSKLKSDTLVMTNGADLSDTVLVVEGKAVFEGAKLDTPQNVMFLADGERPMRLAVLFLENGTSSIDVTFVEKGRPEIVVKGGKYQTTADSLKAVQDEMYKACKMDSLMAAYGKANAAKDQKTMDEIMVIYNDVTAKANAVTEDYVKANPTTLFALEQTLRNVEKMDMAAAEERLAGFKALPEYAANKNVEKLENYINGLKSLQPGQTAPDFVQNDPEGNPVTFSDVYKKNKITMVDFWASWCGPCRRFNPTLTKIYKEYKDKGFGIIGVSLDKDKDSWVKAIKDDKLDWVHVSDLGYWQNEVAGKYLVNFVPQSIFVDQEGKIIKRQPSEEEIVELLKANL